MSPDFLEDRRLRLETSLVILLDALRVPSAVCGYRGLALSAAGQVLFVAPLSLSLVGRSSETLEPAVVALTGIAF
jgi:hypothetical protein